MAKKKRFSILKLLITIVCFAAIIVSLVINILFSVSKVPNIFGRHIYIVGEDNPMVGDLTTGAALLSKDAKDISINMGDIVICYPADDPSEMALRSITFVAQGDDGSESYYTKDSFHEDNTDSIFKSSIVAVCTGYPESLELGRFITFSLSVPGLIAMVGVPAVLLIIFLISSIVSSRSAKYDEEAFEFYEYEEEEGGKPQPAYARNSEPLYAPEAENTVNPELERKKMSIAENFRQKQVNPESPYQREKEKERTVQFKAPRSGSNISIPPSTTSTAESSFAARNPEALASSAPTADALREEMLRKTAEAERTETFSVQKKAPAEPITDNTGILSKAQVAELSRGGDVQRQSSQPAARPVSPVASAQASSPAAPKKSSSPDISDILGKSGGTRRTKNPSDMSVDDLLKMIEEQKSRL